MLTMEAEEDAEAVSVACGEAPFAGSYLARRWALLKTGDTGTTLLAFGSMCR